MLIDALNICITGINAVFGWFSRLMDAIPGAFNFILAMIGVFTVYRILLVPILGIHIGGAGSDLAHIVRTDERNRAESEKRHLMQIESAKISNAKLARARATRAKKEK